MRPNEMVFVKENYKSEEGFWSAISSCVKILLEADYIMTVRYDEPGLGIVAIEYDDADRAMGGMYPVWESESFDEEDDAGV